MIHIPLPQIQPNPWQTRQAPDPFHVRDLAADIASRKASRPETLGLLQVPAARLVPGQDQQIVQLAYGHNRLAAFTLLAQGDGDAFPGDPDYNSMPLDLVAFTDEEMATSAWTENAARKDLTPIEEATAIHRMMESFSWTQAQVADRLGLARATVANKLRLLRLPGDVQDAMQQRQLTERQAVALMPVLNLPEPALAKASDNWGEKPQELVEAAIKEDVSSERIRARADAIIAYSTISFTRGRGGRGLPFPLDHWFEVDDEQAASHPELVEGLQSHQCSECLLRVKHDGELRCPDETCWDLKEELWADIRLTEAEAATGLPRYVPDGGNRYGTLEVFYSETILVSEIMEEGCPNGHLRLDYDPGSYAGSRLPGFDDVRVVCHHGQGGRCTCLATKKAARTRERNANDPEIQAKRQREKRVRELTAPAFQALADALLAGHLGAWRLLLKRVNHAYAGKGKDWGLPKLALKVAGELLSDLNWQTDRPDAAQSTIVRAFEDAGLDLPWPLPSPIEQLQYRFDRILKWFERLWKHIPSPAEVTGNRKNLAALASEIVALPPGDRRDALAAQVAQRQEQLEDLDAVLADWTDDAAPQWELHASWLITVPPGDVNFQHHLQEVTHPVILSYVAALVLREENQKTRLKALERRLRQLEKSGVKTHRQLADELNVSINAVAIVREVLSGTSADASHLRAIHEPNPIGAALELARRRRCDTATQLAITEALVAAVRIADQ